MTTRGSWSAWRQRARHWNSPGVKGYPARMGEFLRSRVLLALRLSNVWVQLEALSVRLRRVEEDVDAVQQLVSQEVHGRVRARLSEPPQRPQTLRAAPPPPPDKPKGAA